MISMARTIRLSPLVTLVIMLAVSSSACGGDETDERNTEVDAGIDDSGPSDAAVDAASDSSSDTSADALTGTQTLGGSIFNNTGITDGVLRVALVPAEPEGAAPVAELEDDAPLFTYNWRFDDVPLGDYFVVAILDVDEPNSVDDPGPGDLVGRTEDPAGGFEDGASNLNVNVEIR